MDTYKCEYCENGILSVTKFCRFKWKLQCSNCNFSKLFTRSLLIKYVYYLLERDKK